MIARSGFAGDFFFAGQWFPKVGVLWKNAWNCHQYHAHSEFFADFGVFDVSLTVPARFAVGATGKRIAEKDNGDGTKTVVHHQEDVHDFRLDGLSGFRRIPGTFRPGRAAGRYGNDPARPPGAPEPEKSLSNGPPPRARVLQPELRAIPL